NSADKFYGLLPDDSPKTAQNPNPGMSRTVIGKDGKSNWFNSPAADTPNNGKYDTTDPVNQARQKLPLDIEMGAGFLNAKRALTQLQGKQFTPNANATRIGWDYRSITTAPNAAKNVYNLPTLRGGGYISATLTWDRQVNWTDTNNNNIYDEGDTLTAKPLANLDLYLVKHADGGDITKAVWASNSSQYNVEHFFLQLPKDNAAYDLVVVQNATNAA